MIVMLKLIEIHEIPKDDLKNIPNDIEYKSIFQSEGMFDITKKDYLFLISEEKLQGNLRCYGYVYNGTIPSCSEFGYFGINMSKTKRIW